MATTEQKLDDLILAVAALREGQSTSQCNLDERFKMLKEDVTMAQEDATERAKREWPLEFKNKAHHEQFSFNSQVADHVEAVARKIQKLNPTGEMRKWSSMMH